MSQLNTAQLDELIAAAGVDGTREILEAFWQTTCHLLDDLRAQVQAGDCEAAARSAHGIKGSSANIGAAAMENAARLIEEQCRRGGPLNPADVQEITDHYARAREAFEAHLSATPQD